ncbi:TPA: hypothetical protein ACPHFJ_001360 [Enterococcus faecium]|uniref:hypothetical protein n=1 Tax=Enterococcus faecium TaxID=1352 RepID=UPI000A1883E2|nr:hypothetical protein [Enterococcus faecium]SMH78676.1 bactriophage minor structural protein [Enterococcus faecium]SMH89034.1 bactriophage minor structural protein [Enterococcus faecium]SMI29269.1 bactriophage minor structural protein [Enterococcus faecium]SMI30107.1 bactriophage minor structural protein [Enterococcus faecium]SMI32342.1 bactriophage minor structural protein [Enterococcus faecium]
MASSLYNLALDFSKELNYTKAIMARQGDKGITVTVKPFLNGLQMDTSGGTFTLKGTTPSNRYVDSVATSVTSEEVIFSLDGTFMSEAGYYKHCYVEYRKGNQILTTQDIIFFSLGVSDISQGQADEYVSQLEELIRKYNETFDAFMAEIKGRVDSLNQQITDLTGQAKTLQDKLDALKEEISKLGNLQVMYSNSIDFGGYDYSGNPNLMANINADSFSQGTGALSVVDDGDEVVVTLDPNHKLELFKAKSQPNLLIGKTYTMSVEIMLEDDFTGDPSKIGLRYTKMPNWVSELYTRNTLTTAKGVWQKLTGTVKITATSDNAESWFIMLQNKDANNSLSGKLRLRHAKVEYGSTATPYQPNLFDAPYYLSKAALGENIANKSVTFPIKSSDYAVYDYKNIENFVVGEKYVATIKATKPATQVFEVRNTNSYGFGAMKPVEGLTDIWVLEFTPTRIDAASPSSLQIYQSPKNTKGAVQIDWLKIEKGDTRTPNIEQYKYRGIGMRDSNNPKDYVWDLAPEYVENNLATDIKVAEITGKANNYTDGKVSEINSQLTASINEVDTTAKDAQTKVNELDNKIDERINDTATTAFYGAQGEVSNKTKVAEYGVGTGYTTTAVGETHFERQSNGYVKCLKAGKYSISAQIRVQLGGKYASWLYTDLYKDGTSVDNLVAYGVDALQNRFAASGNIVTDLEVNDVLNMRTEIGVADGILQFTSCRTLVLTRLSD